MTTLIVIPTKPAGAQILTQRTQLDGVEYLFRFEWNDRQGGWFMSIALDDDTPLIQSRRMVVDHDLLRGLVAPRRPLGGLWLLEMSGGTNDPSESDLGASHLLHYASSVVIV